MDDLPESTRLHYAHPTEHVPLCIVLGTCQPRHEVCTATRDHDEVTCTECRAGLVVPPYGGWTPSGPWDHCAGGHPPQSVHEEADGTHVCGRCGRLIDKTPCGCGADGHEALSRSFCPTRMREDKAAVRRAEWEAAKRAERE